MNKQVLRVSGLALGLAMALPTMSQAHFRLLAPASWLVENQYKPIDMGWAKERD
ncbi:MAG TPA: hypothetical protein VH598_16095 [Verrucomicrobiae bacterium]|jgi:hypothetical protein|nr:hypothetical protein [Verrucomicrobiae bacterium]